MKRRWKVIVCGLWLLAPPAARATTPAPAAETPSRAPALDLQAARAAFDEGRYAEAAAGLEAGLAAADYDTWLLLGLCYGHLERFGEARTVFDRALQLDPRRPSAWVERGGLAFLTRDYSAAVHDLGRARALQRAAGIAPDAYVRDLLASSLHLAGRADEALALWNEAGQPRLERLELGPLRHTRERVVRRELAVREGTLLTLGDLRRSRLRLVELGVFDRATLRPVPTGEGTARLDVALAERHGFYATRSDFVVSTAIGAAQQRARLRYLNAFGRALNFGGEHRWQAHRPETALWMQWPRPFGVPANLELRVFRGRQDYALDGPLTRRARGLDLTLRHVAGRATVVQLQARWRRRHFSEPHPAASTGSLHGLELGLEQRLHSGHRLRLDAGLRAFGSLHAWGSQPEYSRGVATLEAELALASPDGAALERSVLAWRLRGGLGSGGTPLDDWFAPGASPEMELPLRAHRLYRDGVIGSTPLGRRLLLSNLEWRRRLWSSTTLQTGLVIFYDAAVIGAQASRPDRTLHDLGLGLRLALRGASTLRVDYALGASDSRRAFSLGLGQAF